MRRSVASLWPRHRCRDRAARRRRLGLRPPAGNFSINHLSRVSVSADRVDVRYILDQAEIPTVQERSLDRPRCSTASAPRSARRLVLLVDGRRVALSSAGPARLSFPPGAGGLHTTRVELSLRARVDHPHRVELHDGTFPDRIGWKAVVSAPGSGTAVRTDAPSGDPTGGLRRLSAGPADEPARRARRLVLGRAG